MIVDKSTVPVGTARSSARHDRRRQTSQPFSVVSNPEFLKQGAAIEDFMKPDRVVMWARNRAISGRLRSCAKLYAPVHAHRRADPDDGYVRAPSCRKLRGQFASWPTRISFMNEIANVCELVGADVDQVRKAIGSPTGASARPSCFRASATAAAAFRRTSRRC